MKVRICLLMFLIAIAVTSTVNAAAINTSVEVYFVNRGADKIQRYVVDTATTEDVIASTGTIAIGMDIDEANDYLYWYSLGEQDFFRTDLDGSGQITLAENVGVRPRYMTAISSAPGDNNPYIAYDYAADADPAIPAVAQTRGDIVSPKIDVVTGAHVSGRGIDYDATNNLVYWSDGASIRSADLSSTTALPATTEVLTGNFTGVALDVPNDIMYYGDGAVSGGRLMTTPLSSSDPSIFLADGNPIGNVNQIALDFQNEFIYYSDRTNKTLNRVAMDGSSPPEVLVTGVTLIEAVAVRSVPVPEPSTIGLILCAGLVGIVVRTRRRMK